MVRKNVFLRPDKGRWDKEVEAEMLASLVALRKAMEKYPIRHAVSFHSSIQRAEIFKDHNEAYNRAFEKLAPVQSFHVSGKTPTGTRARVVSEFAATERGLITNARCLTEGVDVPDIDCVMFADPRRSAVDIVQAVGRALRPAKGKKMGYVIVPILHDANAKPDDILASEEFQEILTTLRALAANDERIIEYFRSVSEGKRRSNGGSVVFDIDEKLAKRIDIVDFVREIDLKCWDRLAKLSWRPFEEAREFVRSLNLKSQREWYQFTAGNFLKKGMLPADIPVNPQFPYYKNGWNGFGDWLGTGQIAPRLRVFLPFERARAIVHTLNLKNQIEWKQFCKGQLPEKGTLPDNIPSNPNRTYANCGWRGFGDWIGTEAIANQDKAYMAFHKARAFAQSLKLRNRSEWHKFTQGKFLEKGTLPIDIPANPDQTYKTKGWNGYGDWLGTGSVANFKKIFRPFKDARAFVHSLKLKSSYEWKKFCNNKMPEKGNRPADIPTNPNQTYLTEGWRGMGDWLGTGSVAPQRRVFLPFEEARAFVHTLKLKGTRNWHKFCNEQLPDNIPSNPHRNYANKGWKGMGDWLGTGTIPPRLREYRSFEDARSFVHLLNLKNANEWRLFCKGQLPEKGTLPSDIPATPHQIYKTSGWNGFGDWLGTGTIASKFRECLPFEKAREFVHSLKLKSQKQWIKYCRGELTGKGTRPPYIPYTPSRTYSGKGWRGYADWLGK
jgi:hypothetical protein